MVAGFIYSLIVYTDSDACTDTYLAGRSLIKEFKSLPT